MEGLRAETEGLRAETEGLRGEIEGLREESRGQKQECGARSTGREQGSSDLTGGERVEGDQGPPPTGLLGSWGPC